MRPNGNIKNRLGWNAPTAQRNRNGSQRRHQNTTNNRKNKCQTQGQNKNRNHQVRKQYKHPRNFQRNRNNHGGRPKNVPKFQPTSGANSANQNASRPNRKPVPSDTEDEESQMMFVTIPLLACGKRIMAALSCGSNFTRIGKELASTAIANGFPKKRKQVWFNNVKTTVQVITIMMGVRTGRMKPVDCVLDRTVPAMGAILGLRAMKALGYQITVDRIVAEHHGRGESIAQQNRSQRSLEPREEVPEIPFVEEDYIEALNEAERKEIESWEKEI